MMHDTQNISIGGQPLTPTEEFNEAGARLYRWPNGQPALYFKEMPDAPTAPCIICGLADGDLFDSETFPGLPSGEAIHKECFSRMWDAIWFGPDRARTLGEIKADIGARIRREKGGE